MMHFTHETITMCISAISGDVNVLSLDPIAFAL
jgi:hypothetical protein